MAAKTREKRGYKAQKQNETVKIRGKTLPRYAYKDTPKGTWREDRKTGKLVWRKLGSHFPEK